MSDQDRHGWRSRLKRLHKTWITHERLDLTIWIQNIECNETATRKIPSEQLYDERAFMKAYKARLSYFPHEIYEKRSFRELKDRTRNSTLRPSNKATRTARHHCVYQDHFSLYRERKVYSFALTNWNSSEKEDCSTYDIAVAMCKGILAKKGAEVSRGAEMIARGNRARRWERQSFLPGK